MLTQIVRSHVEHGIVVDTNVLLLLFVGRFDKARISSFKRTSAYTRVDYEFLEEFLALFRRVVTTPWVMSEVSNLAGQFAEPQRSELMQLLGRDLALFEERYVPSAVMSEADYFPSLGLTDSSFFAIARQDLLVLSTDWRLVGMLQNRGIAAVNFTNIRPVDYS